MNMWGLIFNRKKGGAPAPAPVAAVKPPPPPPRPPAPPPPPKADASDRLAAAQGNDEALLALARDTGIQLAQRLAALEALDGETVLKQAEREFRDHDRRLHQVAKRRLQARVATRQAREQAGQLIAAARRLLDEPDAPVNQAVALDHAWQALDATLLEDGQREAFTALSAQLAEQSRQRSEQEVQRKRRLAALQQALAPLQTACRAAAEGTLDRAGLAAAIAAAQAEADAPSPAGASLAALQQTLQTAAALDTQLALLEALLAQPDDDAAHAAWQQREALPDAALATRLQSRHEQWQQQRERERQQQQAQGRQQQRQRQQAQRVEQQAALADTLTQVEAALEAGQLADAQRQLSRIDSGLHGAPAPEALQARLAAAQARLAQLRGWQHWSGGRARDELVAQAEALAAATVAGADAADPEVARLSIKQRSEVIATLRARWKEIDQLGGAGGRALWPRFDAALKAAHEPVAAHHAAQKAAREANLAARNELLDVLEAETRAESDAPPEPRQLAAALERFQIGWRKLGPLEHTVPRAAQAALTARLQAAQARAEQPLQAARGRARAEREALLTRARALGGASRDLVAEARALQAEWQAQARALPLARGDEQTLWTEFKGAIDAAFAARQQAFDARDAELEVHATERAALIARLQLRPDDSPAAQRRLLAEVDAAWNRCGPAPRARAAALEAEYHAARQALRQWLDSAADREWQARCDAWEARLAQQASGSPALDADELLLQIETAWELPTPPAFEAARRQRKLLAMKAALEGRRAAPAGPAPEQAFATLLDCPQLEDAQRARLAAIVAAQRRRGPQRAA